VPCFTSALELPLKIKACLIMSLDCLRNDDSGFSTRTLLHLQELILPSQAFIISLLRIRHSKVFYASKLSARVFGSNSICSGQTCWTTSSAGNTLTCPVPINSLLTITWPFWNIAALIVHEKGLLLGFSVIKHVLDAVTYQDL
jgi:hypothetical protein